MTTLTAPVTPTRRPLWPVLLLALLLAVAVAASAHALSKHDEAAAVVDGCNRGPHSAWQVRGRPSDFWLLCETDSGEWGVRLIRCTRRGWRGVTAFTPDASEFARGSLQRGIEYLSARADNVGRSLEGVCD